MNVLSRVLMLPLLVAATGLAGCGDKRGGPIPYSQSFGVPDSPSIVPLETGYKIAPMDTLNVKVFRMPDLTGDYEVDLTGQISLPLIGSVSAADLTTSQQSIDHANMLSKGDQTKHRINIKDGDAVLPVDDEMSNVDVLHMLYTTSGLRKSSDFTATVIENSIEFEWKPGKFIRVMNPFDLLDSRVQNAAGLLEEKGPHVLTQARWAIEVVKAVLTKLAADEASAKDRLGQKIQAVFRLSKSQAGRKLLAEHDIDVLDAIDIHELRQLTPVHNQQLDNLDEVIRRRRAWAGKKKRIPGRPPT